MSKHTFQSSQHPGNVNEISKQQQSPKAQELRNLALAETLEIIESLTEHTPLIVLNAPKPVFNYITFRCADWYSQLNPICSEGFEQSRTFFEEFRQLALTS